MDGQTILNLINSGTPSVTVPAGTYVLPSTFQGFKIAHGGQQVTCDMAAVFVYPHGYSGPLIEINDLTASVLAAKWTGGQFHEDTLGLPYYQGITKKATGIRLYSHSANGVFGCIVRDVVFKDPNVGITLEVDSPTAFVNNNEVSSVVIWHPQTYGIRTSESSAENAFRDILMECVQPYGGPNLIGVYVDGYRNVFDNVNPEDVSGSQRSGVVAPTAKGPRQVGGTVNSYNFVDHSPAGNYKVL